MELVEMETEEMEMEMVEVTEMMKMNGWRDRMLKGMMDTNGHGWTVVHGVDS